MWQLPESPMLRGVALVLAVLAVVAVFAVLPPLGQGVAALLLVLGGFLVWQGRR